MVIGDITNTQGRISSEKYYIASPGDRLLAFALDFLILSPIVGLIISIYLQDLRSYVFVEAETVEVLVTFFIMIFVGVTSTSILKAIFLVLWGATPGQKFLYLQVVDYKTKTQKKITWSQALIREFSWWLGVIFLFFPMLEIFTHPMRRVFHDRISDSIVINLKKQDSRPHKNEMHFFSNWMQLFFAGCFIFVFAIFVRLEDKTLEASWSFAKNIKQGLFCEQIDSDITDYKKRLDQAISLYLSEALPAACLQKEADFALWQKQKKYYPLAYFAKTLLSKVDADQDTYEKEICSESAVKDNPEVCAMIHFLKSEDDNRDVELRKTGLQLQASRVLLMQDSLTQQNYDSALPLVEDLMKDPKLEVSMNRYYVRLMWQIQNKNHEFNLSRAPASADKINFDKALKTFKQRFDIE